MLVLALSVRPKPESYLRDLKTCFLLFLFIHFILLITQIDNRAPELRPFLFLIAMSNDKTVQNNKSDVENLNYLTKHVRLSVYENQSNGPCISCSRLCYDMNIRGIYVKFEIFGRPILLLFKLWQNKLNYKYTNV